MQDELIRRFHKARRAGDLSVARSIAGKMVLSDSKDPIAWLLLSIVIDDRDRKIFCLEKAVQLAPDQGIGDLARSWISRVQMDQIDDDQLQPIVTQKSPMVNANTSTRLDLERKEIDRINQWGSNKPCPYLGMLQDPESHTMIPDGDNRCFRSTNSLNIDLSHQNRFCLKKEYIDCPIYIYGLDESTTKTFRSIEDNHDPKKRLRSKVLILLFLAIIVVSILYVIYLSLF